MSSITPNGVIELFRNCPIDKDYNHTLYFNSIVSQNAYFSNLSQYKKVFTNQMYQRAGKNSLRVQEKADNVLNYNYMRFMNSTPEYAGKWFYAFIDNVEYINENVCQVNYTLDVMQTWYFDYELGDCFVEREHSEGDGFGEHLVDENLNVGDQTVMYKKEYFYPRTGDAGMFVCVALYVPNDEVLGCRLESDGHYSFHPVSVGDMKRQGNVVNGIYNGCSAIALQMTDNITITTENLNRLIINLQNINATIVSLTQVPYHIWQAWSSGTSASEEVSVPFHYEFLKPNGDTYRPKNNKLYNAPFHKLIVSNNDGDTRDYDYMMFSNPIFGKFQIEGVPYTLPEIMAYPKNYKNNDKYYEEGITITNFPLCSWNEDSFKTWWQQNKSTFASSLISTAVHGVVGMGIGTTVSQVPTTVNTVQGSYTKIVDKQGLSVDNPQMGASLATNIYNQLASLTSHRDTRDTINGQANLMGLRVNQGRIGFTFYELGVNGDVAEAIDNYFNMFGYAVKKVKIPNVRNDNAMLRPHWNYVKTSSVIIHGATNKGLPAEDEDLISKIYNKGITFWMHADEIGDYSLDNSPSI